MIATTERLKAYLESTLAAKREEQLILDGEISGLQTALTTLNLFVDQEKKS
jgi:hypothetical protein